MAFPPKLTIAREDFVKAWKAMSGLKHRKRGAVMFEFRGRNLKVGAFDRVCKVPARGHWPGSASIPIQSLKFVKVDVLPDPVTIRFEADLLIIGPYRLKCKWTSKSDAAAFEPTAIEPRATSISGRRRIEIARMVATICDLLPGCAVDQTARGYFVKWGERRGLRMLFGPALVEFQRFALAPGETYSDSCAEYWKQLTYDYVESWGVANIVTDLVKELEKSEPAVNESGC